MKKNLFEKTLHIIIYVIMILSGMITLASGTIHLLLVPPEWSISLILMISGICSIFVPILLEMINAYEEYIKDEY